MAAEVDVWNPSFDVTPAPLREGIITEHGLVAKAGAQFGVRTWLAGLGSAAATAAAAAANSAAPATVPGAAAAAQRGEGRLRQGGAMRRCCCWSGSSVC